MTYRVPATIKRRNCSSMRRTSTFPRLRPRVPELEVRALQVRGTLAADQLDIRGGYEASLKGLKIAERETTVPESLRDTLQFDVADSQIMLGETAAAER